jgi:hypothetical protein
LEGDVCPAATIVVMQISIRARFLGMVTPERPTLKNANLD